MNMSLYRQLLLSIIISILIMLCGSLLVSTFILSSHQRLWQSAFELFIPLAVVGLLAGWLGSMILGRLRKPINAVVRQAQAITERRFVTIAEPDVPELRHLAAAMNASVGRLKAMFEEEAARLENLRREANTDELTGLANRSHFMGRLHQSLEDEEGNGGSLLLIRLADLAGVNCRLGRVTTDDFLKQCAAIIRNAASSGAVGLAARLNGADFAIMLPGETSASKLARQLLHSLALAALPFIEGQTAVWIGFGRYDCGMKMGELLTRVDAALASAEAEGRNALHEVPTEEYDALNQLHSTEQWRSLIQQALDKQWLSLTPLPVIDFSGRLSHQACQLRLRFSENGEWVSARQFLPFAERLRLKSALDLAAVSLGLAELAQHPELPGMAITLSPSSVACPEFCERMLLLLAAHRHSASRLWLDVSECGALTNLRMFREFCLKIKPFGCRIGLKHFGHQFSQVRLFHDFGLDFLKVDSSFVCDIDSNAGNTAFLKGLTAIAHGIGLLVLAEGVDTLAEFEALRKLGFDGAGGPAMRAHGVVDGATR